MGRLGGKFGYPPGRCFVDCERWCYIEFVQEIFVECVPKAWTNRRKGLDRGIEATRAWNGQQPGEA